MGLLVHVEFGYAQRAHVLKADNVREGSDHEHIVVRPDVFEDMHQVVVHRYLRRLLIAFEDTGGSSVVACGRLGES